MNKKIEFLKEKMAESLELINNNEFKIVKKNYLGKKGIISSILKETKKKKEENSKEIFIFLSNWKKMIIDELERKNKITHETRDNQDLDFFLEGKKFCSGSIHPITQIKMEIYEIFYTLGYEIIESSEIETSENNFDYLNIPQGHPARDANDTFYLKGKNDLLLRTHTSNTQVRMMKKRPNQEMKVVSSGKVYRRDEDDTTHTHQFTQVEGFWVGKNINLSNLKGNIEFALKKIFGSENSIRFRPSYFPFTEPSFEVDARCIRCLGDGCNICKNSGWVEILGCGLIHKKVLKNCGFDDKLFTGFAFGMGLERLVMIKYGLEDIRSLYNNDLNFLKQFNKIF